MFKLLFMQKIKNFIFSGKFLFNTNLAIFLWFGFALFASAQGLLSNNFNNFTIFKYSYSHIASHQNLYLLYPKEYYDAYMYGPTFTVLIAPFTFLPNSIALILWGLLNASLLYFAIRQLPIKQEYQNAILILASNELLNTISHHQFNAIVAACIILGFTYINKGKDFIALLFIVFATITKIYGIVGFSFFFFSRTKLKFIVSTIFWFAFFFILPVFITSFSFLLQSYKDWFDALVFKSHKNVTINEDVFFQDISVMGFIRRNFNTHFNKDAIVLFFAAIIFLSKYIQHKFFNDIRYRLYFLCSVLLFVVIFSTSSESPTYIIAFPACCLWLVLQPASKMANAVFLFCLAFTSFSNSDIFGSYVRSFSVHHSIRVLPCFVLWVIIIIQIHTKQFLQTDLNNGLKLRFVK